MARSDRLFRLLQAMRVMAAPITAARLAEETGVSLRSLYRDIESLRLAGARIEGDESSPERHVHRAGVATDRTGLLAAVVRRQGHLAHPRHGARVEHLDGVRREHVEHALVRCQPQKARGESALVRRALRWIDGEQRIAAGQPDATGAVRHAADRPAAWQRHGRDDGRQVDGVELGHFGSCRQPIEPGALRRRWRCRCENHHEWDRLHGRHDTKRRDVARCMP